MRRTRVALLIDLIWLAAFAASGLVVWRFGMGWVALTVAALLALAAICGGMLIAARAEKRVQRRLAELGHAVGAAGGQDLEDGVSAFVLAGDDQDVIERFAAETIPAVHEHVARERNWPRANAAWPKRLMQPIRTATHSLPAAPQTAEDTS